jgi:hypothetical protein
MPEGTALRNGRGFGVALAYLVHSSRRLSHGQHPPNRLRGLQNHLKDGAVRPRSACGRHRFSRREVSQVPGSPPPRTLRQHGPVIACSLIGYTGDVSRFRSRDQFAAYNGTAPIEVSSGGRTAHRLSRRGNRQLNHAIHMAAICQIRQPHSNGQAYFERKVSEGNTKREAIRSLKRQIGGPSLPRRGSPRWSSPAGRAVLCCTHHHRAGPAPRLGKVVVGPGRATLCAGKGFHRVPRRPAC